MSATQFDEEQARPQSQHTRVEYPRLRHSTFLASADGGPITMVVGKEYFEITEEFGTLDEFFQVRRYLDGRHTVPEIARRSGVDEGSVTQIVYAFDELGLLRHIEPSQVIDGREFAEQIESSCQMWARQVGHHRLFAVLEEGSAPKEVFQGLVLETYHYVHAASRHISTALSNCREPALADLLAEYFVEEYNHSTLLQETLGMLGIPKAHVADANPLTGTLSLINNLCDIARSSTISYLACTSLFEAREADMEESAEGLRKAACLAGFSEEAVDPLISHMEIDVKAGHVSLIDEAIKVYGEVSASEAHRAANDLHNLKHSFDQFHDNILEYYSNRGNNIPRLFVDYFSL